ncbi:MAG: hypothetical protein AAGF99_00180 [Bacteroidota bacterium]
MRRLALPFATAALIALASLPVQAQQTPVAVGGVRYTVFHLPGEATKEVVLMGDQQSGIYVIGETITLDKFLALTGLSFFERETERVEIRKTVRVFREQGGERVAVYEARTEEMLVQSEAYPTLQDRDIIAIETQSLRGFDYRQVLQTVSQLATLTLLGLRLYDAFNN